MGLLHAESLTFGQFSEVWHPPYAILSHRWGNDEITHQQFLEPDLIKGSEGYRKITSACKATLDYGLEFLWVDTICIDKTSISEPSRPSSACSSGIRAARYALRTWRTLASAMAFLAAAGLHEDGLCSITRINEVYLRGGRDTRPSLQDASVATRMSWASLRKTTVEEDMAYCLLGIFDVNIPLLYGEGPKAFQRLQMEIAMHRFDPTLLAWQPRHPYYS
jgi:hypothetical protein